MERTVTWSPGDTWRKVSYLTYSNSLDYRYVIQQNPEWNVTITPPIGTVIRLNTNGNAPGTINTVDPFWVQSSEGVDQAYFPFDTPSEYESRVAQYSFYSLVNSQSLNGYTSDSEKAIVGEPQVVIQ